MLAAERHSRIVTMLQTRQYVRNETLADALGVSLETIRRDLATLADHGQLMRVRGGASRQSAPSSEEAIYAERSLLATEQKTGMARAAASLVQSGMTLMIDVGTSCLSVAKAIPADFTGRVVTCSLLAAMELADRVDVEVLVAGGRLRSGDLAVSNGQAVGFLEDVHPDLAFLGSGGLDAEAGLTDYYPDEVASRRVVLRNASRAYVLADSSKHGHVAPFKVCDLGVFAGVITDNLNDRDLTTALRRAGVEVLSGSAH
jgi:DeoR family transcriptional regulator, fructose operon transcriptional repressor